MSKARTYECSYCHATITALSTEVAHRCVMNKNKMTVWKEIENEA